MYHFKILTEVDPVKWNNDLKKSNYATFFQTTDYLFSNSRDHFPIFIYVLDDEDNVIGQLGLRIIRTVVRYSSPLFLHFLRYISSITTRAIWLDGPIIHTTDKNTRLEILQNIMNALILIANKYNLVQVEGYTPAYDRMIDDNYKKILKNNFSIKDYVTFILDMKKNVDDIWNNLPKRLRQDINRAKRRNISIKELDSYEELKEYLLLSQKWAKTKGILKTNPFQDVEKLWEHHKKGIRKFFLSYEDNTIISGLSVTLFNNIIQPIEVISSYEKSTSLGGTLLTWQSIEWGKMVNAIAYDFTGGKKEKLHTLEKDKVNSLLYYKSKWGGEELPQYNSLYIRKKIHYKLYLFLFNLVRKYHSFKKHNN